jgi:hypothetical protein
MVSAWQDGESECQTIGNNWNAGGWRECMPDSLKGAPGGMSRDGGYRGYGMRGSNFDISSRALSPWGLTVSN